MACHDNHSIFQSNGSTTKVTSSSSVENHRTDREESSSNSAYHHKSSRYHSSSSTSIVDSKRRSPSNDTDRKHRDSSRSTAHRVQSFFFARVLVTFRLSEHVQRDESSTLKKSVPSPVDSHRRSYPKSDMTTQQNNPSDRHWRRSSTSSPKVRCTSLCSGECIASITEGRFQFCCDSQIKSSTDELDHDVELNSLDIVIGLFFERASRGFTGRWQ